MKQQLPLVLIPQHFGSLVFDRRSSRYMPFDPECTDILQRLRTESIDAIAQNNLELMPTFTQYSDALELLVGDLHGLDPFSPQARSPQQARVHNSQGCGAANLVCSISVQGDVNPCSFLGPQHNAGNIRQQSFQKIWNQSQIFQNLRRRKKENFQGGCRARAQTFGGSIHAFDPWLAEWKKRTSSPR